MNIYIGAVSQQFRSPTVVYRMAITESTCFIAICVKYMYSDAIQAKVVCGWFAIFIALQVLARNV